MDLQSEVILARILSDRSDLLVVEGDRTVEDASRVGVEDFILAVRGDLDLVEANLLGEEED